MPAEDDDEDDRSFGLPLPPDDRLWRHPSEVGRAPGPEEREGRHWLAPAAVGLVVGGAVMFGLAALGDDHGSGGGTERVAVDSVATVPVAAPPGSATVTDGALDDVVLGVRAGDQWVSAVLYRDDGHLITSAAAVAGETRAMLRLDASTTVTADVIGVDDVLGVAVLRSSAVSGRPGITLGRSARLAVGDATRFGRAGDSGTSVEAAGVVNDLSTSGVDHSGTVRHGVLRIDAPADAALGGDAVIDGHGHLVAITLGGGPSPSTLAVPIDEVRRSADQIVTQGWAGHSWLGLEGTDLPPEDALDLAVPGAVLVSGVEPDSPAAMAGLAAEDVIVAVDGDPVHSIAALVVAVRRHDPGDPVDLDYLRDGRVRSCSPVLVERQA